MTEHGMTFCQSFASDDVVAECSCGWFSPPCPSMDTARVCFQGHIAVPHPYDDIDTFERGADLVECSFCGGDGVTECDDPIQCLDPDCTGRMCTCSACDGRGHSQVVW